jgi:hypothetical protein
VKIMVAVVKKDEKKAEPAKKSEPAKPVKKK